MRRPTAPSLTVALLTALSLASLPSTDAVAAGPHDDGTSATVATTTASGRAWSVSRVSLRDDGREARFGSRYPDAPSISATGRYVSFVSLSPDVVAGDTNGQPDVFVRDRLAGTTTRVSVRPRGGQSPQASGEARISADGGVVVFTTAAALVPADTHREPDVYARDLRRGTTTLVSARADGGAGDGPSFFGSPSADGRLVAFQSQAGDLAPGDDDGIEDVFVRDLATGTTRLASVTSLPPGTVGAYFEPRLSGDGRTVLFGSLDRRDRLRLWARDLVTGRSQQVRTGVGDEHVVTGWGLSASGRYVSFATDAPLADDDRNGAFDASRLDRSGGGTVLLSRGDDGRPSSGGSDVVDLSADGSVALFTSASGGLVAGDSNGLHDVFRRDVRRDTTTRVSVSTTGEQADAESGYTQDVAISADGRHLAFVSFADNLVPGDRNGDPDVFVWDRSGDR